MDNTISLDGGEGMEKVQNIKEVLGIKETATEETLQSIASTLKRIELILHKGLLKNQSVFLDDQVLSEQMLLKSLVDSDVESE